MIEHSGKILCSVASCTTLLRNKFGTFGDRQGAVRIAYYGQPILKITTSQEVTVVEGVPCLVLKFNDFPMLD